MSYELKKPAPSIKDKIKDAGNNFAGFLAFIKKGKEDTNMEEIRRMITQYQDSLFISLEEYTGLRKEDLEKEKPGVCGRYNSLTARLKNENLSFEELEEIIKEGLEVVG